MPVEIEWSALEKIGIAGVSALALWILYKLVVMFFDQWKVSTEVVNRNTESFNELTKVFEKSHQREIDFQKEVLEKIQVIHKDQKAMGNKVSEIHDKIC